MLRNYIVFICLFLILNACNTQNTNLQSNKGKTPEEIEKEIFLKVTDVLSDEDKLKAKLKNLNFGAQEVYDYCQKNYDIAVKTKFINYVCKEAVNDTRAAKEDFWGSLRYDMERFTQVVAMLKENHHQTFMDIGSGNGEKLFAALCLGFKKVYGLEYLERNKKISENFLQTFISQKLVEVVQGDALKASPAYYAKANFAYMYSPMKDNDAMATLFKRVMDSLKDGAILLEVRLVYFEELRKATKLKIPQHRGWFAVKRENGRFFYRTSISGDDWIELDGIIEG